MKNLDDHNLEDTIGTMNFKRESFHLLFYIFLVFLISFVIINYVGQRTQVQGQSMEGALYNQDNLIIDKLSYQFTSPNRFDIIVFPVQTSEKYFIKRIIGLPGETIQIIDGEVYINSHLLEEDYGNSKMNYAGIAKNPITLNKNEYFVLGDNRNHSSDSRNPNVGVITSDQIIGKAWLRIWPLKRFGFIH